MFCDWQKLAECYLGYTSTKTLALLLINYRGKFFLPSSDLRSFANKKKHYISRSTHWMQPCLDHQEHITFLFDPCIHLCLFPIHFFIPNILHHQFIIDHEFEEHKESTSRRRLFDVFQMWAAVRRTKWWGRGLNSLHTCQELNSLLWFSICVQIRKICEVQPRCYQVLLLV